MQTFVQDNETFQETEATMFEMLQSGTVSALIILENAGANTANYRFQEYNGTAWVDIGTLGSSTYNTLTAGQVRSVQIASSYPKVRLVGNASGGSTLEFSVTRFFSRAAAGPLPLINL